MTPPLGTGLPGHPIPRDRAANHPQRWSVIG